MTFAGQHGDAAHGVAGDVDDLQGQPAKVKGLAALQLFVHLRLALEALLLNGFAVEAVGEDRRVGVALQADCAAGVVAVTVGDENAHHWRAADLPDVGHAGGMVIVLVVARIDEHGGTRPLHQVDIGRGYAKGLATVGHLVDAAFKFHYAPPYVAADSEVVP